MCHHVQHFFIREFRGPKPGPNAHKANTSLSEHPSGPFLLSSGETGSHSIAQAGLELMEVLLPWTFKIFFFVLLALPRLYPRAQVLSMHFATELRFQLKSSVLTSVWMVFSQNIFYLTQNVESSSSLSANMRCGVNSFIWPTFLKDARDGVLGKLRVTSELEAEWEQA